MEEPNGINIALERAKSSLHEGARRVEIQRTDAQTREPLMQQPNSSLRRRFVIEEEPRTEISNHWRNAQAAIQTNQADSAARTDDNLLTLSLQMQTLRVKQRTNIQQTQQLEAKIHDGEIACGRMIQQYLDLGRAIEMKRRHIREDKELLSTAQQAQNRIMDEIDAIMTQMSNATIGMRGEEAEPSAGRAHRDE